MKIIHIKTEKAVKKSKEEIKREQKENQNLFFVDVYKRVPLEEPTYIVEMTMEELQLVSFYLEIEKRKPIMNIELDTKIAKENKQ